MKMPKVKTVEDNLYKYARMVGWKLQKNPQGTYSIFDEHMQYIVRRYLTRMEACAEVYCELSLMRRFGINTPM